MRIISRGRAIGRPVALATGLDPNERIGQRVACVGGETLAEASADDIAPVAPGVLLGGLDAVAGWRRLMLA